MGNGFGKSDLKEENDASKQDSLHMVIFKEIFSNSMPKTQEILAREGYINKKPLYFCLLCVDIVLRGVSQVFLCNHPISGIFICIGLAFTSFYLLGYALLGTAVSTFTATAIARPPKDNVLAGLCGYDGALVGCACWAFLDKSCSLHAAWLLSALCGIVHVACENILKVWELPCFTFAFNIVTIMIIFAINAGVVNMRFAPAAPPAHDESWNKMSIMFAVDASIRGVGQFMFADTTIGSAFVIAGIAVCSRKGAAIAMLGATIGWLTAFYILAVANVAALRSGLHGYNCAGTCSALAGGIFYKVSDSAVLVGVFGSFLACLMNVGIIGAFGGSLPSLTFPFILSAWLIMLSRTKWLHESHGIVRPLMRRLSSGKININMAAIQSNLKAAGSSKLAPVAEELSGNGDSEGEAPQEFIYVTGSGKFGGIFGGNGKFGSSSGKYGASPSGKQQASPARGAANSRNSRPVDDGGGSGKQSGIRRGISRGDSFLGRQVDVLTRNMQFERVQVPFLDYYPSMNLASLLRRNKQSETASAAIAAAGSRGASIDSRNDDKLGITVARVSSIDADEEFATPVRPKPEATASKKAIAASYFRVAPDAAVGSDSEIEALEQKAIEQSASRKAGGGQQQQQQRSTETRVHRSAANQVQNIEDDEDLV